MTLTLDLQPDIERNLLAQARLRGVSLKDYVLDVVAREAHVAPEALARPAPAAAAKEPANLVELSESVRGLLTDEEVDTLFKRNASFSRPPIEFE